MVGTSSVYSGSKDSFSDPENDKDVYDASYIVKLHNVLTAIQDAIGTDIEGSATDLKTRLARCLAENGAMRQGTSFPASPNQGDFFYRTDEDVMYIYDGSAWDAQGQSLSNLVFSYATNGDGNHSDSLNGVIDADANGLTDTDITVSKVWGVWGTTYRTVKTGKFKKLAGVNTVTVYAHIKSSSDNNAAYYTYVQVNIGGYTGFDHGSEQEGSWEWINFTVDVSSLTDGNVYDLTIQLKHSQTRVGFCDSIIGFAS